ncbi:phosphoribosylglycinamide formyltransferase [Flavobacterium sp. 316]|uniref:Phosphoribosylglycinamide formyltransferase n=1 Tax=Flavobacterium sediminilitoris TaxID=2024526 RepID=A0ABY4HSA4_9FLAO|nr:MULTISPECIES: phosphoribosylglycinamide formyltransferase [Flavobacterium]KIX21171.1 phosphoribosylglycinamide formyltransferase [Flavobacterium sp. 316]UOX35086.1 phosphoribosylglycinamide formyltransferase [Flavobacterium sediminilitoris]
MQKIVLFASGNGSNAEKIILHFKKSSLGNVVAIFTNNPHAKVLEKAKHHDIQGVVFNKVELNDGTVLEKLDEIQPNLIVLAGFLLKFPEEIINFYPQRVINIHPALLPNYGGKGMYGMHVHKAVLDNKEIETGITIHYVNGNYDEGEFIFQKSVNIEDCITPEDVAKKVQELEHQYFPEVIEKFISNNS